MADPSTTEIAAKAVQAIPWGPIILGAVGIVATLSTVFAAIVTALLNGWKRERVLLKGIAKRSVLETKGALDELDAVERGQPSIPPMDDTEYDDSSAVIDAIRLENERRAAERRRHRILPGLPSIPPLDAFRDGRTQDDRRTNETERDLRKFVSPGDSTPPGGFDPPPRRKMPSRRG